jgi:hypothetical protein
MIAVPHVRRQPLIFAFDMRLHLAVPEEREAVLVSVADVVVFEAGVFDRLEEMDRLRKTPLVNERRCTSAESGGGTYRARPEVDSVLDLPVLEPGAARLLPDRGLVELVEVCVDVVERFLLHVEGAHGFGLDLLHTLDCVFDTGFDRGEEGSAGPGCSWSLFLVSSM